MAPCFGLSPHGKGVAGGEQEWDLQGVGPRTGAPVPGLRTVILRGVRAIKLGNKRKVT